MAETNRWKEIACWLLTPEDSTGPGNTPGINARYRQEKREPAPGWIKILLWCLVALAAAMLAGRLH